LICDNLGKVLLISGLLLIPCFWHPRIEAGDLASHTYNAWLAQLIAQGRAPGLATVWVWQNVLFDLILSGIAKIVPLLVAEKIAVSIAVLVFFWGSFALATAASGRAPWFLTPCLAMFTYGWTFEMGFLNYYLSLGLAFFAIAIFWRGRGRERWIVAAIAPAVLLAHAMGLVWMLGALPYIWIAERVKTKHQYFLLLSAIAFLGMVHFLLYRYFIADPETNPRYFYFGADQLMVFAERYWIIASGFLLLFVLYLFVDWRESRGEPGHRVHYWLPFQLWVVSVAAVILMPDGIHLPHYSAALALVTERLTLISSVMLCCILAVMRPRRIHLAGFGILAAIFFAMLFHDTAKLNRMESRVEQLVATLPPGQRVLATIFPPSDSRVVIHHIVDRACIGHCFSYENYEAPSRAFRIRVLAGNPEVVADATDSAEMQNGTYTVRREDLPAYEIYQPSSDWTELSIRSLEEGEDNDERGTRPEN
jgi:hypothetical protein